jgi:hypothetical protein
MESQIILLNYNLNNKFIKHSHNKNVFGKKVLYLIINKIKWFLINLESIKAYC